MEDFSSWQRSLTPRWSPNRYQTWLEPCWLKYEQDVLETHIAEVTLSRHRAGEELLQRTHIINVNFVALRTVCFPITIFSFVRPAWNKQDSLPWSSWSFPASGHLRQLWIQDSPWFSLRFLLLQSWFYICGLAYCRQDMFCLLPGWLQHSWSCYICQNVIYCRRNTLASDSWHWEHH